MRIYLASHEPGLLAELIDSGHDIACGELLDSSTLPTDWTDKEKVLAIIASADKEIAVAKTADVIGYAGNPAPGIQTLARMAGKPLQALWMLTARARGLSVAMRIEAVPELRGDDWGFQPDADWHSMPKGNEDHSNQGTWALTAGVSYEDR